MLAYLQAAAAELSQDWDEIATEGEVLIATLYRDEVSDKELVQLRELELYDEQSSDEEDSSRRRSRRRSSGSRQRATRIREADKEAFKAERARLLAKLRAAEEAWYHKHHQPTPAEKEKLTRSETFEWIKEMDKPSKKRGATILSFAEDDT